MTKEELSEFTEAIIILNRLLGKFEQRNETKKIQSNYNSEFRVIYDKNNPLIAENWRKEKENKFAKALHGGGEDEVSVQFTDGSFRTVKNGLLQYRYVINKEQKSVYGKTKQDCWNKRIAAMLDKEPIPGVIKITTKLLSFSQWTEQWLNLYKKPPICGEEYFSQIKGYLKNYILPIIGNKALKEIKAIELQVLLSNIKSASVRTQCASILSGTFRQAKVCGLIDNNPYDGVKIKRYEQPKLGALTHRQQQELLIHIDNTIPGTKLNDFIRCLLMTGLRQGELNGLQAKNIDFENMEINVCVSYKRATKTLGKPKTKNGIRCVPMAEPLSVILQKYVANCITPEERVFGWLDANWTYRQISAIFKEIKLKFGGHILRHTFITNAYELGFPPFMVQRWVGHASVEQANTYLALRKANEYVETEITEYMRLLKSIAVIKI